MTQAPAPTDSFRGVASARTAALQQAICDHPFNQALAAGTLDPDRFAFYLAQDARYLVGFSHSLAAASTRAPDSDAAAFFAHAAHTALVVEGSLHDGELRRLGWDPARIAAVPTSPTCQAYVSYLSATAAEQPWPVLVAALLPCFWVYHHVGLEIAGRTGGITDHPYRAWIDTYADETFGASVAAILDIADAAARADTPATVERMLAAFSRATEYEWLFWDSAWRLESWPTAHWLAAG